MRVAQLKQFKGLNESALLEMRPDIFIDGKNFLLNTNRSVRKSWGTRKEWSGHGLTDISKLFFHDQESILLLALGNGKLMAYSNDWSEIGSGLFSNYEDISIESYRKNPHLFWGNNSAYYNVLNKGREFPKGDAYTASSTTANKLVDEDVNFYELEVTKWMRVKNITDDTEATITEVNGPNTLTLDSDIMTSGDEYRFEITGFVDLDQVNKGYFLNNGGSEENYVHVAGHSPVVHLNSLWLAGRGDYKNTVFWSRNFSELFYEISAAPYIQYVSVGGDDSASGSTFDEITSMVEFGADIIVFKKRSVHRIYGHAEPFRAIPVHGRIGTVYPETVQLTKRGIVFLSSIDSGFWIYDGNFTNISQSMIDDFVGEIDSSRFVRSGYIKNRYYLCSIGSQTLVYDVDTQAWSRLSNPYGSFAEQGGISIAASNKYSDATSTITDPQQTGDQTVTPLDISSVDIVSFDDTGKYERDEDGSGGSDLTFEVRTPFMDMGAPQSYKTFEELVLFVSGSKKVLEIDVDIDSVTYEGLKGNYDPRPLYGLSKYYKTKFKDIPFYTVRFKLPFKSSGNTISITVREESGFKFNIFNGLLYFNVMEDMRAEEGESAN